MFICQVTGRVSKPGEKMNRIPVLKRDRVYFKKLKNEDTGKWEEIEVGRGWEIVREIAATDEGVAVWNGLTDSQRTMKLARM
ncbi:hypothetical protein EBR43_12705 [bacterium]|nr:hypothetical protein [bacterium]